MIFSLPMRRRSRTAISTRLEVTMQIVALIVAGTDTTRLAIAGALSQLLQNRDQWSAFCQRPDALKQQAAREGLRFDR